MLKVMTCLVQQHDLRLVALSAAICGLGCFTTVTLLARASVADRSTRVRLLAGAAGLFGCSVWSLHFVAMLAFMPGLGMSYDIALTVASVVVAAAGALLAFLMLQSKRPVWQRVCSGGTVLGLTVVAMHYLGTSAMRFSGFVLFDGTQVVLSVAIAIGLAIVAFARASDLLPVTRRLESTVWLALSICGMHFTGMGAMTIAPGAAEQTGNVLLGTTSLAVAVGGVSVLILLASLAAVLMEQRLSDLTLRELGRMRLLSNLAHEGLFIHRAGTVLEMNSAGGRLFRSTVEEMIGRPVATLFPETSMPAILRHALGRPETLVPEEIEIRAADGALVAVELSCQPIDYLGRPATAVALRDLTDRKRDEARIRHLARHDALTNLPNRYNLEERLTSALDAAAQEGAGLAVLYLDLDRFKPVNDLYGHAAGDALLVQVSRRILAEIHATDTLARIGGDEFVLLLPGGAHPEQVAATARRIIQSLARPFQIEGNRVQINASVGVALYPGDGGNAETLLRAADTAMYRVKDEGRGAMRFFEASMDAQLQARRQTETELSGAIERNELVLFYQPIVNGRTGEVETFEALIRWDHPQRGLVPPAAFVPLAEETGLISSIGAWVIDTACRTAAAWPQPWRVSVNVSPSQFRQTDICEIVAAALRRHGLSAGRLVIEITESALIEDTTTSVEMLMRLREMGIRLALDDFGTGFSSLAYLQMFKFDKIKIDKSFVRRLAESEDALTITRAIINLGHNLGLGVTAEGVETAHQLELLQALAIDQVQGYIVARPAPIGSFSDLTQARARALFQSARPRRFA